MPVELVIGDTLRFRLSPDSPIFSGVVRDIFIENSEVCLDFGPGMTSYALSDLILEEDN